MTDKKFTRKEVAELPETSTVFIIENAVYDVGEFLDEHPGGHEVLVNVRGKDATEDFQDIGHSMDAREMMAKWRIGELVDEDKVQVQKKTIRWEEEHKQQESFINSWKFPVLIGLIATALYTYLFG